MILKVWPSYIAEKRSFVAFTNYQMFGPTLFLVAQVYLIFYQYISRIYLNCTCCVRWENVTPPPPGRYVPANCSFILKKDTFVSSVLANNKIPSKIRFSSSIFFWLVNRNSTCEKIFPFAVKLDLKYFSNENHFKFSLL